MKAGKGNSRKKKIGHDEYIAEEYHLGNFHIDCLFAFPQFCILP